jgi:anti-sigma factor RsiW
MATSNDNSAERMTAYLDAELDATEAEQFEQFLDESPEARAELEDLRKVMKLVGSLGEVEAPADFAEKVSRKIRRRALLERDGGLLGLVTLPFQVICIVVILVIAALNMMAQLDAQPQAVERDPSADPGPDDAASGEDPADAPLPIAR